MRFFIDHCVPETVARMLEAEAHSAERLRNHLPTDAPDEVVLSKTQELGAILVSLNGDFANIVQYPPSAYGGIIALQVRNRSEVVEEITERLIGFLKAHPERAFYQGKLLLVEAHRIRIRDEAV